MKVTMYMERNVTEAVNFEVIDMDHLKELIKDYSEVWSLISEQCGKVEEVNGEVLETKFEIDGKEYTEEQLSGEVDEPQSLAEEGNDL